MPLNVILYTCFYMELKLSDKLVSYNTCIHVYVELDKIFLGAENGGNVEIE